MQGARELRRNSHLLAVELARTHFDRFPDLARRYGEYGRRRCIEDGEFHLSFLASAVDAGFDTIFLDYIAWAKTMLAARGVSPDELIEHLRSLSPLLATHLRESDVASMTSVIDRAIDELPSMPSDVPSFIDPETEVGRVASEYLSLLIDADERGANGAIARALDRGMNLVEVCSSVFEVVQQEVGRLWQLNRISVAVEHYCTQTALRTLTRICTARTVRNRDERRRVLAMCAPDEHHDLGLLALTELLALEGWQTFFLGANVPATAVAQMCSERGADVLLVSASLPTRIAGVSEVVQLVHADNRTKDIRIIVGGRAFNRNPEVWRVTGADAFAASGAAALALLRD